MCKGQLVSPAVDDEGAISGFDTCPEFRKPGGALWRLSKAVMNSIDCTIAWSRGLPKKRATNAYLKGIYAPTDKETFAEKLEIEGRMPSALNGIFVRTGPNPMHRPIGNYHWFDGDGMTHAVRIKDGSATYNNRYVETSRFLQEKRAGHPLFEKIGDSAGAGYLVQMVSEALNVRLGVMDKSKGFGRGNTALVYHAKRLLTLEEGDMPYGLKVLCSGVIETLGRCDFNGKLKHEFTAHPKQDQVTGELFGFGYSVENKPYCHYTVVNAKGEMTHDVPINLPNPIMMHDCALTQDYFILLDLPLVFHPERMVKNASLPFLFDKSLPSRFGLMPRHAKSEDAIKWFELPAMTIFHTVNAWQEGPDVVKLAACCFDEFELDIGSAHFRTPDHMPRLNLLTFNLKTGQAERRRVSPVVGDFPQYDHRRTGRKTKYAYLATMPEDGEAPGFVGVTKLDMEAETEEAALAGQLSFPEGFEGGEAYYVAADPKDGVEAAEDEGYLVTYIMHLTTGESKLAVYDAKTMSSEPLATVTIPQRVPAGFHGLHVKERDLRMQAA